MKITSQTNESTLFYDLTGLKCPLPVLKTRVKLKSLASGDHLHIRSTDPMSIIDIPHFCSQNGHELVEQDERPTHCDFLIRKA